MPSALSGRSSSALGSWIVGAKARGNERISMAILRALNRIGLLKRQAPIAVETLARQMIRGEATLRDAGEYVLAERAILDL